jgi:hypothetical protein
MHISDVWSLAAVFFEAAQRSLRSFVGARLVQSSLGDGVSDFRWYRDRYEG